ncbi:MAG: MBOAT family protein [Lachnospiraceae bacterium]|nr:MBOAT family protein [Lachnospiraceae bacterium]
MYFNSYIFIFLFIPLVLSVYFLLNRHHKYRLSQAWVVGMSLWFYSYSSPGLFLLIMASMIGNYVCSALMERCRHRRLLGAAGVIYDLGLLFYFKYFDFFITNVNGIFGADWPLKHVILPMGISFYTFQQISYIVDRAAGKAPHYDVLDYASFVTFFPQLVAGPIVRHDELVPQFRDEQRKHFSWENFSKGFVLFTLGLAKKVLLADILALPADYGFANIASLDAPAALLVMLSYSFQLYLDFSAYSDMALGLGQMMNIRLPVNFDSPYRSHSVKEFWNRWHITLGAFLTEYVYFPLGGSRKGKFRKALNTLVVFFLSGMWHGAAWTYILWGTSHGIIITLEDLLKKPLEKLEKSRIGSFVRWLGAFILINLTMVIFRADSLGDIPLFFEKLFSFRASGAVKEIAMQTDNSFLFIPLQLAKRLLGEHFDVMYLLYFSALIAVGAVLCRCREAWVYTGKGRFSKKALPVLALLFFLSIVSLSKVVVFLYSNF